MIGRHHLKDDRIAGFRFGMCEEAPYESSRPKERSGLACPAIGRDIGLASPSVIFQHNRSRRLQSSVATSEYITWKMRDQIGDVDVVVWRIDAEISVSQFNFETHCAPTNSICRYAATSVAVFGKGRFVDPSARPHWWYTRLDRPPLKRLFHRGIDRFLPSSNLSSSTSFLLRKIESLPFQRLATLGIVPIRG